MQAASQLDLDMKKVVVEETPVSWHAAVASSYSTSAVGVVPKSSVHEECVDGVDAARGERRLPSSKGKKRVGAPSVVVTSVGLCLRAPASAAAKIRAKAKAVGGSSATAQFMVLSAQVWKD
jgi:hypothetical protein